jgi:hypothetical protein
MLLPHRQIIETISQKRREIVNINISYSTKVIEEQAGTKLEKEIVGCLRLNPWNSLSTLLFGHPGNEQASFLRCF